MSNTNTSSTSSSSQISGIPSMTAEAAVASILSNQLTVDIFNAGEGGPIFYKIANNLALTQGQTASLTKLVNYVWNNANPGIPITNQNIIDIIATLTTNVQQL